MNVVFMGTPPFACASLRALVRGGHRVSAVVTRPDKPTGRGRRMTAPPVRVLADELELDVLQPTKVNSAESIGLLRELEPDVVVVAAYGAILRDALLNLAPLGAVNVHASVLPEYRGVAPAPWCLVHGALTTGVSTMLMDAGVDTGPVLLTRELDILPLETAGELLHRLGELGGDLLLETLDGLESGTVTPVPQPLEGATYAPRLDKEHGNLDLERPAHRVFDQYRGVTPAPGARMYLGDEPLLIESMRPGGGSMGIAHEVQEVGPDFIRVAAADGAVDLLRVRPAGKGSMDAASFARGRRIEPGFRFSSPPSVPDLSLVRVVSS